MEIINFDAYLDGGTVQIMTTDGSYFVDNRIGSATKGVLFSKYPSDDKTNIIPNQIEIKSDIIKALDNNTYEDGFCGYSWKDAVLKLLNK